MMEPGQARKEYTAAHPDCGAFLFLLSCKLKWYSGSQLKKADRNHAGPTWTKWPGANCRFNFIDAQLLLNS
jgi:hypothetical protein